MYTLGSMVDLRTANIVCALIQICYTLYFIFLPESPSFLIRKNRIAAAEKSLKLLRGQSYDSKAEMEYLRDIQAKVLMKPKSSFLKEVRSRATLKAFFIILSLFIFFQASGINPVMFYTTRIFIDAEITLAPDTATIILGVVQVLTTIVSMLFIDRFGRVFSLKISFCAMIVGQTGIGTFFYLKDMNSTLTSDLGWLPLTSLSIFCIGFSVGIASIPFVLLGEIFSDEAKKVIAPFAQTLNFVVSSMMVLFFPTLITSIGAGFTFYSFAVSCVIGLLFTTFAIPETKGKTLAEIQAMLEMRRNKVSCFKH